MKLVNTATSFLIDVARDAIIMRAKRDNNPSRYDAEKDPEGYVTSILCALRHWCRKHHIPWRKELKRSNDFFQEDLGDFTEDSPSTSRPKIQHLQCPSCTHRGSFKIQVEEFLLMFHDYLELDRSQEGQWGNTSRCICPSCNFHGVVVDFQARNQKESCHG